MPSWLANGQLCRDFATRTQLRNVTAALPACPHTVKCNYTISLFFYDIITVPLCVCVEKMFGFMEYAVVYGKTVFEKRGETVGIL
jgi:hypothetical protein